MTRRIPCHSLPAIDTLNSTFDKIENDLTTTQGELALLK
jgi:hypothetical protein